MQISDQEFSKKNPPMILVLVFVVKLGLAVEPEIWNKIELENVRGSQIGRGKRKSESRSVQVRHNQIRSFLHSIWLPLTF